MSDDLEDPPRDIEREITYLAFITRNALREEGISCSARSDDNHGPSYLLLFNENGAIGHRFDIDPDTPALITVNYPKRWEFDLRDPQVFKRIKEWLSR